MYIRKTKTRSINNTNHFTYRLVESRRDPAGKVKQHTLLNLGAHYSIIEESDLPLLSQRIENIISGQQSLLPLTDNLETEAQRIANLVIKKHAKPLIYDDKNDQVQYREVDIGTIENSDIKTVGSEHLAYETAKKINLIGILSECGLSEKEINSAMATIIGRLIAPGSEVSTVNYLRNNSALDEILATDFSNLHKNKLYKISDVLIKHQKEIEQKLYFKEKELFALSEIVTLYDLTNTYFEGESNGNDYGAYGHSKEKRKDCKLVTLALVLDGSGFPKKSHIFKGNIAEAGTLQSMLEKISDKKAVVVMDAGIATEANITWLNDNNYKYLVISRKRNQSLPDIEGVVVKDDPENKITTFLLKNDQEAELYCHSQGVEKRSGKILEKYINRFEEELKKIANGLQKKTGTKKYDIILQRIGRIKEKYSMVARQFNINIIADDTKGKVTAISWENTTEKQHKKPGIYCIRTNQIELNNQQIWNTYRMLNDIEEAFRTLKTDLGLRPIFHQTTDRISGHIFISVLAYHILHSVRYQLKLSNINDSWQTIMFKLSTHYRITTSLQQKNAKPIHIRKSTRANPEQLKIYRACNIPSTILQTTITTY
jgi:Transposase DDE domain